MERLKITVTGIVQGVGFRPFVFEMANNLGLLGFVLNTSSGVEIEIQGPKEQMDKFLSELKNNPPPSSTVELVKTVKLELKEKEESFLILKSKGTNNRQAISPDISICTECEKEIIDRENRRFGYPFTNCYNCGPRFTIIKKLPYDRVNTSMAKFKMCLKCSGEYSDTLNRRFHAEPIACSKCGPKAVLVNDMGKEIEGDIFKEGANFLLKEKVVAIKGLGGFNLACVATSNKAIKKIRAKKQRPTKPLALMVYDLEQAKEICHITKRAEKILCSKEAPIVLLPKKDGKKISSLIAPGQNNIGIMIANTPLHKLLIREVGLPLVMTSGNLKGEPIITDNDEAIKKLTFADYFIIHNRDILAGYDDSVIAVSKKEQQIIRMGRGLAPKKISWGSKMPPMLALGGDLKNSFALACGDSIFLSQYVGDLEDYPTFLKFEQTVNLYKKLFKIEPKLVISDMHPEYFSHRWALGQKKPVYTVQHHKAHIASVMVENNINDKVLGVAFDGIGYGEDGNLWGGEFFVGNLSGLKRVGSFSYAKMPGGNLASKEPARMAYSYLMEAGLSNHDLEKIFGKQRSALEIAYKNSKIFTSSVGRIFDGAAFLLGFGGQNTFEAEAAMFVENIADYEAKDFYPYQITGNQINFNEVFLGILKDLEKGQKKSLIAGKFQNTIVDSGAMMAHQICKKEDVKNVALSGGVFQNSFILEKMIKKMQDKNLTVFFNNRVPLNDGGLALGQIGMVMGEKNVLSSSGKN